MRIWAYFRLSGPRRRLLREAVRSLLATRRKEPATGLFGPIPGSSSTTEGPAIGWAVRTAARHLPGTWNCLAQARAATRMLRKRGIPHEVHVGARKGAGLEAHAWVAVDGRIVVGDLPDLQEYSPFTEAGP